MEDLPEKLRELTHKKYFPFIAVIFFAFLTALVFALLAYQSNNPPLDHKHLFHQSIGSFLRYQEDKKQQEEDKVQIKMEQPEGANRARKHNYQTNNKLKLSMKKSKKKPFLCPRSMLMNMY